MKKKFIYFVVILLIFATLFYGCVNNQDNLSITYNNAVKLGYEGSLEDFYAFINNDQESIYDIAVECGFTGTKQEWLESLKGKSAYQIAADNGFKGTEQEWLESLKGEQGLQGIQGEQGEQGIKGIQGIQGKSLEYCGVWNINTNYINNQTKADIVTFDGSVYYCNQTNTNIQPDTDINYWTLFAAKGEQGEQGIQGIQGEQGETPDVFDLNSIAENAIPSIVEISASATGISSDSSGIILNTDGYVLTNAHCITYEDEQENTQEYSTIKCNFKNDSTQYTMEIIAYDVDKDFAIIKFINKPLNLQPITIQDSDNVKLGDNAVGIGNALGIGLSVTAGHISDTAKSWGSNYEVLQTDTALNPGNSGGALLNDYGQLIGMVTFKLLVSEDVFAENMNLALTTNSIIDYIDSLELNINYTLS